jgi:hypothetical protein
MSLKELDNLAKVGLLKIEPADQNEFDGLLDSGRRRLVDANKQTLAPDSQFDLAYNAAHALSLAALRWHGYRPNKRFVVFQSLPHTLSLGPEIWRVIDKCHGIRNSIEYEGYAYINMQLLTDLLKATDVVLKAVMKLGPVQIANKSRK